MALIVEIPADFKERLKEGECHGAVVGPGSWWLLERLESRGGRWSRRGIRWLELPRHANGIAHDYAEESADQALSIVRLTIAH